MICVLPSVIEGVDEEKRSSSSHTTRCKIAHHPLRVTISVLLEREHGLVGVAESEIEGLGGEVSNDVGSVSSP